MKQPVLVEDRGLAIPALKGFPGVYVRYAEETIGAEGIIALMADKTDKRMSFIATTTYIDAKGNAKQFHNSDNFNVEIAKNISPVDNGFYKTKLSRIFFIKEYNKTASELSAEEFKDFNQRLVLNGGSLGNFARWFAGLEE